MHTCIEVYVKREGQINVNSKDFLDKNVFAEEEKIGKVKELGIDPEDWNVTHLEIELTKDTAESVLGAKKGGVRNMLAISALKKGDTRWTDQGLHLKVSKAQLHMYLRPVMET
jgi:sporulation protein YlmC with PRC-barrel domain